jgi:hypothetical protein
VVPLRGGLPRHQPEMRCVVSVDQQQLHGVVLWVFVRAERTQRRPRRNLGGGKAREVRRHTGTALTMALVSGSVQCWKKA